MNKVKYHVLYLEIKGRKIFKKYYFIEIIGFIFTQLNNYLIVYFLAGSELLCQAMGLQGGQDLYSNLKPLEKHKCVNSLPYSFNKFVSK